MVTIRSPSPTLYIIKLSSYSLITAFGNQLVRGIRTGEIREYSREKKGREVEECKTKGPRQSGIVNKEKKEKVENNCVEEVKK